MPEEKLTSSYDTDHPENRSQMINSSDFFFIVMQMQKAAESFLEDVRLKFHEILTFNDPSIRLKF